MTDDAIDRLLDAAADELAAYGHLLTGSEAGGARLVEDAIVRVFARRRRPGAAAERLVKEEMRVIHLASIRRHTPPQDEPVTGGIGAALAALTPPERAVVVLRHHDRFAIPQIAAAMRTTEDEVEALLAQSLAKLTATLGPIDPVMDPVPVLTRGVR